MKVTADKKLNPALQKQVQGVRGGMMAAAEKKLLPKRFTTTPSKNKPEVKITDTRTSRSVVVPLCDYYGVRVALAALFPDQ